MEAIGTKLLKMRKSIETDISSAHSGRGAGVTGWMREDDRDMRADLSNLFDDLSTTLAGEDG